MGIHAHKARAPKSARVAVLTVSTSRGIEQDKSGRWIGKYAAKAGHQVVSHQVVVDDVSAIVGQVRDMLRDSQPDAIIVNGGTGIGPQDVTIEALRPLFRKELTAFGALFAQLSFDQIDSAAILSRAAAGIIYQPIVFCLPGSLAACKLACRELILPELGHAVGHLRDN